MEEAIGQDEEKDDCSCNHRNSQNYINQPSVKFNGILYKQQKGGPICDDITRLSASLVMYSFIEGYKKKLLQLSLLENMRLVKVPSL